MSIKNTSLIAFIFLVVAAILFLLTLFGYNPSWSVIGLLLTFCRFAGIIIFILGFLLHCDSIRTPAIITIIFIVISTLLGLPGIQNLFLFNFENFVYSRYLLVQSFYYLIDFIPLLFFLFTLYKNDNFIKIKNLILITLILVAISSFFSIIAMIVGIEEMILRGFYSNYDNYSLYYNTWWFPQIYPIIRYSYLLSGLSFYSGLLLITMSTFLFLNDDKIELDHSKPISVKEWVITYLIMSLPIINFVMLFVWAFSKNIHLSKANWAKAALIWIAIIMTLYFILFVIIIGSIL